ncbi:MAG: DUF29 family protein [Alphaproteobacteria bacterium]|jgi:predicted DNA-binding ribbon-helix-helix protein|nr:DUF29 family protein [Alphaproteobacteria bacterium]
MPVSYDEDFYSWTQEQAALLRAGRLERLDAAHLAEEVADMGRSQIREFASRLAVIIGHLLKLQVQTERTRSNEASWRAIVAAQRNSLARHLADNPGLKNPAVVARAMADGWGDGLVLALRESGLPPALFPPTCPYSLDQVLGEQPIEGLE